MRVLIDTNVLADLLLGRDPYYELDAYGGGEIIPLFFDFCQRQICSMKLMIKYRLYRNRV